MISNKQKYFEEVYEANKDKIYRLCMGFTGNAVDADDLFQEIVLKVWMKLDSFRKESAISTWIYRVATNTALVYVNKKNKAAKNISDTIPEALAIQHTDRDLSKEHQLNQLHRAIAQLKEDKDLQEWQSLWKEQASNPKDITTMMNQINQLEKKNKRGRIIMVINFIITISALSFLMPLMENPLYIISILFIGGAMLMIMYQMYKYKFNPAKSEEDFSNQQFLESHIQKLKAGMELTSKYMWVYGFLIIAGINLSYIPAFAGKEFGLRLLIHLTVSVTIGILFAWSVQKRKKKNELEIVPLIEQLEAMSNEQ